MYLPIKNSIAIVSISMLLLGCASDGPKQPPRLDLTPNILVEESKIGDDFIIQLNVINQIDTQATSAYGIENNLSELFTDLITEAFERQDFEVIIPDDRDPEDQVTELEVTIKIIDNQIQQSTLSSNIIAKAEISVVVKNAGTVLTLDFSSTRTQEVALKPSLEEVTGLTELAIAQVVKRLSLDEKIKNLTTRKQ